MSARTYIETAIVVDANRDPVLSGRLDDLMAVTHVKIEPVTKRHAEIARRAYRDFGKGRGHPAGLGLRSGTWRTNKCPQLSSSISGRDGPQ